MQNGGMASAESSVQIGNWKRLDGIDLLRGLAIFFVLMNHINIRLLGAGVLYTKFLPAQLVHFLVWNGQLGVQIFFVVSGFLITSITLRRWGQLSNVNLRSFYLFRFARIAPLLFLLLAVLTGLHFANVPRFVVQAKTGGIGRSLLAAITFHINVLEARHGYLPANWDVLWSLSVEEMFYLFFPLACRIFGRGKLFLLMLVAFAALGAPGRTLFAHGNEIWSEYCYLGGMEGIALGCLTAMFVSRIRFSRSALLALSMSGTTVVVLELHASRLGNSDVYRRYITNAMEESSLPHTSLENWPIQLRGLPHSYVRSLRAVHVVSRSREADALGAGTLYSGDPIRGISRRCGRARLFRAHESLPASPLAKHPRRNLAAS